MCSAPKIYKGKGWWLQPNLVCWKLIFKMHDEYAELICTQGCQRKVLTFHIVKDMAEHCKHDCPKRLTQFKVQGKSLLILDTLLKIETFNG